MKTLLPFVTALSFSACTIPELATPEAGSCDAETALNRWPQFEGTKGAIPVFTDDELGWDEGQVPTDFQLTDQFGDPVCLWQMVGKYVVLDSSALWCEPCKEIARTLPCQSEAFGDDVVFMTFIVQDNNSIASEDEHAQQWSDTFELDGDTLTPVVNDGGLLAVNNFPGGGFPLPTVMLLDQELRVVMGGSAESTERDIQLYLEEETGVNVDDCLTHSE
ncbi:MAG: redoxin domain-containing protein [Myxococcales bacterium]|nr:redoxin domain-containing protein [Myxococcales bacterium]